MQNYEILESGEKNEEELLKAKKSYQRIQKEISPFIRKRKVKKTSNNGKWCDSSVCELGA